MSQERRKLVAIDGNSLFYRAFFGTRPLSTPDGQPTNAIFGLALMLLKLLEDRPEYMIVAFDTPEPTFRHIDFPDYKAHRKPMPDELYSQAPLARELFRTFGIPVVECPGLEADDILGHLAKEATDQGIETEIVTGDLDTLQLVNDTVKVLTTQRGVTDTILYDRAAVEARFGLTPDQMTDYKGLKGDASDNIPGVPGIGDKTAVDLLKRFGTLEGILEHIGDLPEGKIKRTLTENAELARKCKWLATIVTDIPAKVDLSDAQYGTADLTAARELFVRLGFRSLLNKLPDAVGVGGRQSGVGGQEDTPETKPVEMPETVFKSCATISTYQELDRLVSVLQLTESFAFDCRVSGSKSIDADIDGISFFAEPDLNVYVPVTVAASGPSLGLDFGEGFSADMERLRVLFESETPQKWCHDYKLCYAALKRRGITLRGVTFDTKLGAYLIDPSRGSYDIDNVAFEFKGSEMPKGAETGAPSHEWAALTCAHAETIFALAPPMSERLVNEESDDLLRTIEMPLSPILAEIELTGVAVDTKALGILSTTLQSDIKAIEDRIYEQAGESFNIGSPKQLQTILFEKLGIQSSKKTKTGFSTSASVLEELGADYPIVGDILSYRELTKIKSTYADSLPKLVNPRTGRVHTTLNQTVAATGRLSSSDPNLQNIPVRTETGRLIRKAFIASPGLVMMSADYSQIELRILAHVTEDEGLVTTFESGMDIHLATACKIFDCEPEGVTPEMRRRAKTVNFAVLYGMADFTLGRQLGIPTKEAKTYIDQYFAQFPMVRGYMHDTVETARETGYVTTLFGRRRYFPELRNTNFNLRMAAERAAINTPIQGSAADIIKLAMIKVNAALKDSGLSARMLLQVHDELLFEAKPEEIRALGEIVREGMEHAFEMKVPVEVAIKTGQNWSEMEQ